MKIIVFPHAGGFGITFYRFVKILGSKATVKLYDYSGHGARMNEPLNTSMQEVIDEAVQYVLKERKAEEKICLFGHSAGAIVAYEAAVKLELIGKPVEWVAVSGHSAPDCQGRIPEDDGINAYLMDMGGTSEAILKSDEYRKYLYPIVRSDFHLLKQYSCAIPHPVLVHTKGAVFWGEQDLSLTRYGVDRWNDFFAERPRSFLHRGGHFYIYDCWEQVCDEICTFTSEVICGVLY